MKQRWWRWRWLTSCWEGNATRASNPYRTRRVCIILDTWTFEVTTETWPLFPHFLTADACWWRWGRHCLQTRTQLRRATIQTLHHHHCHHHNCKKKHLLHLFSLVSELFLSWICYASDHGGFLWSIGWTQRSTMQPHYSHSSHFTN